MLTAVTFKSLYVTSRRICLSPGRSTPASSAAWQIKKNALRNGVSVDGGDAR